MQGAIRQFIRDDSAQDIVEYGYLAALVGLTGILVWGAIVNLLGLRYTDYNNNVQNVWFPDPPP
jgi:Flp pilus assembly pilin Flp